MVRWAFLGVAPLAASVFLGACADSPERSEQTARVEASHALVANYCAYGARSWKQVQECVFNSDPAQIKRLKTNAARFARGELTNCLTDAGRFCREGGFVPADYPPSWKRLLDLRHVRKGKPDPQCGYYDNTLRASIDAEHGDDRCHREIDLYCAYGSVSDAQRRACEKHVTWGQIKGLNTNAANYSRSGGLDKCRADAGPFCRTVQPDYDY
jgi:hypothetical protein